jgi:serine/threonine-protein kinase ATR
MLSSSKDSKSKKDHAARFLQGYLLGLMARFTDVINDSVSPDPPVIEQRRCIRALTEMIQICQANARIARPQV